jgi:hydroxymethylbilane synthase
VKKTVVIGTRGSKLALWQADYIQARLEAQYPDITVTQKIITTTGDKILDVPLAKIGGKGLFTKELETAMLNGEIDLAVHSMKDVPSEMPEGLVLGVITSREHEGDAFVSLKYNSIDELPLGAKVGTSSLRRKAQILKYRPDLKIYDLRGNVGTRLEKLEREGFDGIILAVAGLRRLGLAERIAEIIPHEVCLPAVGQGALGLEYRESDTDMAEMLDFLNDEDTGASVRAERAFLKRIEGGCQVPVGIYGKTQGDEVVLEARILSTDGKRAVIDQIRGKREESEQLGLRLAERMLEAGGDAILAELTENTEDTK